MKGLHLLGSSHRFQGAIPKDVREHFGGKKKYSLTFKTKDEREAERLAAEAEREFKSKVIDERGEDRADPTPADHRLPVRPALQPAAG
jgi:hypothetical protein